MRVKLRHLKSILIRRLSIQQQTKRDLIQDLGHTLLAEKKDFNVFKLELWSNMEQLYQSEQQCVYPQWNIEIPLNLHRYVVRIYWKSNQEYELLMATIVDLTRLKRVGGELGSLEFQPNELIFELQDGYYTMDAQSESEPLVFKVRKDQVKNSFQREQLELILKRQIQLEQMEQEMLSFKSVANEKSTLELEKMTAMNDYRELQQQLDLLQREIVQRTQEIQNTKLHLTDTRSFTNRRQAELQELNESLEDATRGLGHSKDSLQLSKQEIKKLVAEIASLQIQLLQDLYELFPLGAEPLIRNLHLPNSVFKGADEEKVATALGFVTHFIICLSVVLEIPLRYPMTVRSSRSMISDPVSINFQGNRDFPLYSRGSERMRFDYAVFLMNKNIEQLMNCFGLYVKNLRNTIPNLQLLYQTVIGVLHKRTDLETSDYVVPSNWNHVRYATGSDSFKSQSEDSRRR